MKPIAIVSNRTPGKKPAAGGLAVALKKVLAENDGFWFGWSGKFAETSGEAVHSEQIDGIEVRSTDLNRADYKGYYEGFSNSVLWPAFHHRLDLVHYEQSDYDAYIAVNRAMAKALAKEITPDHLIWVHDYHLIPLGRELRKLGVKNKIGFFLHIPLAGPEMFSAVSHHGELISSFSAYDTIGLQAERDVEALRRYGAKAGLPSVWDANAGAPAEAPHGVQAFPIGTDPDAFAELVESSNAKRTAQLVNHSISARALVLGVDRLDYSKGLPERIASYERLLEAYPDWVRRVHMLQIAPASRDTIDEYQKINEQLDIACGRVMGKFSHPDWIPLNYVKRTYPQSALAGLYRLARAVLVTPLRDGMNLVAHEYIACQNPEDPGVLILSRFAGAAELFPEALLVNPHDLDETAAALDQALRMPLEERKRRWTALIKTVRTHSVDAWARNFLDALVASQPRDAIVDEMKTAS